MRPLLAEFKRRQEGQVAIIFALAFIPLTVAVGAAVDYSRANAARTKLQAALDAAVLAGAKDGTSGWNTVASNVFNAHPASTGVTVGTPSLTKTGSTYAATVSATVATTLTNVIAVKSLAITVRSTATSGAGTEDNSCVLTLGQKQSTSSLSMTFNGSPNVSMTGCNLRSNTSMTCNGHDTNAMTSIAVGTVSNCSNPKSNQSAIPDIYSTVASNIVRKCGAQTPGVTWTAGQIPTGAGVITVNYASYTEYHICGDLTVKGSGYLTGNAPTTDSVIVVENGHLNIGDSSTINTMRTTIVLTGNNTTSSSIEFPNGKGHASTLSLSPSTAAGNPWQGISLYQDPSLTTGVDHSWGPAATFNADGVVYLPNANLTFSGSGASNNSQCTKLVTNTFTSNGSLNLNFSQTKNGCTALGVKQYTGIAVHLTQ